MQLSSKTLDILKNFASINPSLIIRAGSIQRTVSTGKNVLASATIEETIPRDCPIYELSKLIGLLSLFDNPDVSFDEHQLTIRSGRHEAHFAYADASVIKAEDRTFNMPPTFMAFELTEADMAMLSRSASVLKAADVVIGYDQTNGQPTIGALIDVKNASSDSFTTRPETFTVSNNLQSARVIFKNEYLKLLPGAYDIAMAQKGKVIVAKFVNKTAAVEYVISAEPTTSTVELAESVTA